MTIEQPTPWALSSPFSFSCTTPSLDFSNFTTHNAISSLVYRACIKYVVKYGIQICTYTYKLFDQVSA